ncbi:NTP transferase domain-containing protein [Oribacterium sp. NK2B42]|uniref:NTP transferase domain-containing protein n=1 Tax=Oribacterium sp. NK2B42 TaxID=689781 RepID=UPI00041450CD|nr:NTP transferase domain-containing protein [Oribacterium sp. NK2B42]
MKIKNAIIIAAGASSRFVPLSYEKHKALTMVKGEVLIERLIRQLRSAGIDDISIVTGYKADQFRYLEAQGIHLIPNPDCKHRNNNSSIWAARDVLNNSLVLASDLYFAGNPFVAEAEDSWYGAEYSDGTTREWCMHEDESGWIDRVTVGGKNAWYMADHAFWAADFSREFLRILEAEWQDSRDKLWETILLEHLDVLKMRVKKYPPNTVFEFDSLDALREFDESYRSESRSAILRSIAMELNVSEGKLTHFHPIMGNGAEAIGFTFDCGGCCYQYLYETAKLSERK